MTFFLKLFAFIALLSKADYLVFEEATFFFTSVLLGYITLSNIVTLASTMCIKRVGMAFDRAVPGGVVWVWVWSLHRGDGAMVSLAVGLSPAAFWCHGPLGSLIN